MIIFPSCLTFDSQVRVASYATLFDCLNSMVSIHCFLNCDLYGRDLDVAFLDQSKVVFYFVFCLLFRVIAKTKKEYFIKCPGADMNFLMIPFSIKMAVRFVTISRAL